MSEEKLDTVSPPRFVIFSSYGNDSVALIQWAHEAGLEDVAVVFTDTGWAADGWMERVEKAEERAAREAAEAKERERLAAERAEIERKEAAERAEREKQEAIRQAEETARREAEAKEQARLAEEKRQREEAAARAADREHRATINNSAIEAFKAEGIGEATAKKIIALIASGAVPRVTINY